MNRIRSFYSDYHDVIDSFGESKISNRYEFLYMEIQKFIDRIGANDKLLLNERLLAHSVFEYFEDIGKLKSAHDMMHANEPKVVAYTSYWLLRRKPIQLIDSEDESEALVFANEKYVLSFIIYSLIGEKESEPIEESRLGVYKAFLNSLYYSLKFRHLDPQSIELWIMAFKTGQLFPG